MYTGLVYSILGGKIPRGPFLGVLGVFGGFRRLGGGFWGVRIGYFWGQNRAFLGSKSGIFGVKIGHFLIE
jgi:hypothetical protein